MQVHYMSETNEWATPRNVFDELNDEFSFTLDPCSTKENAKCEKYFTKEDNGLSKSWSNERVFMNPPYGREIGQWVEKAFKESLNGAIVVCLIPARTETTYWHNWIFNKSAEVRFVEGRLRFGDSKMNAPFPNAIVIFDGSDFDGCTKMRTQKFSGYQQTKLDEFLK